MKVTIYSKNSCAKCNMTKKRMEAEGIEFEEINIENEAENLEKGGKTTQEYIDYIKNELELSVMPVVVLEDGRFWGDFRVDKIRELAKEIKGV